ncbi:MAG: tetratricopeptide repeat protein [Deltaproteobacteria bacterium]
MNQGPIILLLLVLHGCATFNLDRKQSMTHYNVGISYLDKGDTASAIKELREAERLYNKDPKIVHTLGMAYFKKGEVDLAVQQFKKALELGPGNEIIIEEFNVISEKLKELTLASEKIKGISVISEKLRNEILKKMLAEGIGAYNDGNYYHAMEEFNEILLIDGKNAEAQRLLKEAREKIGELAAPLLKEAVEAYKKGDIDAAIISFKKVMNVEPENKEAKEYLGKIDTGKIEATIGKEVEMHYLRGIKFYTDGKHEEAIESWKKVLELEPRHEKAGMNIEKAQRKIEGVTKTK